MGKIIYNKKDEKIKKITIREFELDGKKVHYDACTFDESLEKAKRYYSETIYPVYIGSSYKYYINGIEYESNICVHFFKAR